jgi:hypothetical protein
MKKIKNYWSFVREAQEQMDPGEEVVLTGDGSAIQIFFGSGKWQLDPKSKAEKKEAISKMISRYQNFKGLIEFLGSGGSKNLPPLFLIEVGTSHTGGGNINREVAEGRLKSMRDLLIEVLNSVAGNYLRQEQALKIIVDDQTYKPSGTDRNFVDTEKMPANKWEQYGRIQVNEFAIEGLPMTTINTLSNRLRKAKGLNFNPDETAIVNAICSCQTFSDIVDMDNNLKSDQGGLQEFINSTITNGLTGIYSDVKERESIKSCLNKASGASGKGDVAQIAGGALTLDLNK